MARKQYRRFLARLAVGAHPRADHPGFAIHGERATDQLEHLSVPSLEFLCERLGYVRRRDPLSQLEGRLLDERELAELFSAAWGRDE